MIAEHVFVCVCVAGYPGNSWYKVQETAGVKVLGQGNLQLSFLDKHNEGYYTCGISGTQKKQVRPLFHC